MTQDLTQPVTASQTSLASRMTAAGLVEMRIDPDDLTIGIMQYIDGWNDPIILTLAEFGELFQLAGEMLGVNGGG